MLIIPNRWHVYLMDGDLHVSRCFNDGPSGMYVYHWADESRSVGFYSRCRLFLMWRARWALRRFLSC